MSIVRYSDQAVTETQTGITRRAAADAAAGATQLRVGDLEIQPGAAIAYHSHPDTEVTHFLLAGELEVVLDDFRFTMRAGDLVLAPPGVGHAFANASTAAARMVTMSPHTGPGRTMLEPGEPRDGSLPAYVVMRSDVEPWTPWERCTRYDMMNHEHGALSTAFSELVFRPGSIAPPHFHPETEEAMYCISGKLMAMYDGDEIPLGPGDMFVAEPGTSHTVFNASDDTAVLLPIHPTVVPVRELVDWSPKTPLPA